MPDNFAEIQRKVRAFMRGDSTDRFEDLALQLYEAQRFANSNYDKFCRIRGCGEVKDWREIPAVPTVGFKEMEMTSIPEAERTRVFFSSGTTQHNRSRHFHKDASIEVYEESLWFWFCDQFNELQNVSWTFLTPSADKAPNSSLAHMFGVIARKAESPAAFFGEIDSEGGWTMDLDHLITSLEKRRGPAAILGTAFQFVHLVDELARRKAEMKLPDGSWAMETGGYKGRSREVAKDELRRLISERLGISNSSIFGEYGMSELSSQAYDRVDGVFRFPPWARAQIISPATGREVAESERGLIRVHDLANIWSAVSVQTEDFGIKMGEGFQLSGRAAQAGERGCSLMSA